MQDYFQVSVLERGNILIGPKEAVKAVCSAECPLVFKYVVIFAKFKEYIARKYGQAGGCQFATFAYVKAALGKVQW